MLDLLEWLLVLLRREASQVSIRDSLCHCSLGGLLLFFPLILALTGSYITCISLHISEVRTVKQKGGCLLCGSAPYLVWSQAL